MRAWVVLASHSVDSPVHSLRYKNSSARLREAARWIISLLARDRHLSLSLSCGGHVCLCWCLFSSVQKPYDCGGGGTISRGLWTLRRDGVLLWPQTSEELACSLIGAPFNEEAVCPQASRWRARPAANVLSSLVGVCLSCCFTFTFVRLQEEPGAVLSPSLCRWSGAEMKKNDILFRKVTDWPSSLRVCYWLQTLKLLSSHRLRQVIPQAANQVLSRTFIAQPPSHNT